MKKTAAAAGFEPASLGMRVMVTPMGYMVLTVEVAQLLAGTLVLTA